MMKTRIATAVAVLATAACTAAPAPTTTAPTATTPTAAPPVAEAALDGLLLGPDQVNTAMGATGMTLDHNTTKMDDDSQNIADKACRPFGGPLMAPDYAGSGWSAFREQVLAMPGGTKPSFDQGVVLFPTAKQAHAFFTASAQQWPACQHFTLFITPDRGGAGVERYEVTVGPVSDTDGVVSATVTYTAQTTGGATVSLNFCQKALAVANNVVVDVEACTHTESDYRSDAAVNLAKQIAAKVPT